MNDVYSNPLNHNPVKTWYDLTGSTCRIHIYRFASNLSLIKMKLQHNKRVLSIALSLFLLTLWSSAVYAQFNGKFEIERHFLDLENFLDWKAYQEPISWRYEWYRTRNGMRASVGSVSMYRFYLYHEIRLETDVGEYFSILYEQKEDSLYDSDPIYREAEFRFGKDWYGSIFGFPRHEKKFGNLGYAVSYGKRRSDNFIQISWLQQHVMFNEKNANTDKNSVDEKYNTIPIQDRIQIRQFWAERLFFDLDYKKINPTEFEIFSPKQIKTYEGMEYLITVDWIDEDWILGISSFSDRQLRNHIPEISSDTLPDLDQQLHLNWTDLYFGWQLNHKNYITFGLLDGLFENQIESTYPEHRYEFRFTTTQLYGKWEHNRSEWFQWIFTLQAGSAQLHRDYLTVDESTEEDRFESKAGVGIVLMEENRYRFYVNPTIDLDFFATRQWDGGNVQLQIYF